MSDGSVVRASGSETTKVENVTKERNLITVTSGVGEYILVSDGTNYMWKDSDENYYPCSVSVKKDSDGYVDESQTFKASDVGGTAYGVSESDFIADIDGNTYKLISVNAADYAGERCHMHLMMLHMTGYSQNGYQRMAARTSIFSETHREVKTVRCTIMWQVVKAEVLL